MEELRREREGAQAAETDPQPCPGYRKDHIKAHACGGSDAVWNMQWQTIAEGKAKDATE